MSSHEHFHDQRPSRSRLNQWIGEGLFTGPAAQPQAGDTLSPAPTDGYQYVAFQQPNDQQPAVATDQEARAMQGLTGNIAISLEVWRDLNATERNAERANYQRQIRDAILQSLRQDFLQGINDPARQWEIIREVLGRPRVLAVLNQHLQNHGFEATVEGNALVFHRRNGERNMLRIDLSTTPAEGGGAAAVQADAQDLAFARGLHQLYVLRWVFDPANLQRIVQNNFREGWNDAGTRAESLVRLNTALAPYNLVARIDIVDPADAAHGWQLVLESTVDRDPNDRRRFIVRGRARPREGQLVFEPEHEAVANHPENIGRLARFIQRVAQARGVMTPQEQTWLFMAFMDLETPAGLNQQERTRRVTARDLLIRDLNTALQQHNLRVAYVENHEGAPALAVYELARPVRNDAGEVVPNGYLSLRPAVPPQEMVDHGGDALDGLVLFGGGAALLGLVAYLRARGAMQAGRDIGGILRAAPRYLAYDMWTVRGPDRIVLQVVTQSDTTRSGGGGGAALNDQVLRLADAPITIEYNGAHVTLTPEERLELGRRAIDEARREETRRLDALEHDTPLNHPNRDDLIARSRERLRAINEARPGDVRLEFAPGTQRISGFRIGAGIVIGAVAAIAIFAAWYAASRNNNQGGPQRTTQWR
jgi:hypothetical protein